MRSCCAERREPKPATVFCRNRRREAKPATVFCRNERRGAKPPTVFAEIGVGKQNRPRFHQKTGKTADSVDGIIKKTEKTVFRGTPTGGKQQKLRFGAPRRAEISKNRVSGHPDEQKTAKTAFRGTPTSRKQRKPRFGAPRRAENSKNCVSGYPDGQKTAKTAFRGHPDERKLTKTAFRTPTMSRNSQKEAVVGLRRTEKRKKTAQIRG